MWGSPYFSPITSPAAAAGNGFSPRAQLSEANQSQQPPRVQQQIPQATPIQYPLVRPRVVTSIQPFGSAQPFPNAFNPRTVSQNIPQPSQMLPPTNQLANRMPMHQPSPRIPSSAPPSSPFNSLLWQSRNAPPFMPSHGPAPQQSFMPATGPFPRGVVALAKQPVIPSSMQTPGGVLPPPQKLFLPSNVPSGAEIVNPPQQPYAVLTVPSPGMTLSVPHRQFTSSNLPSSRGVPPAPPPPPLPGQRPLLSSTFPSHGSVPSAAQRQTTPLTVPPPAGVLSPPLPQRLFAPSTVPPSGGFQIPPQRPFTAPTVPSTRGLLSPPKQPFVLATFSSPRGISSPGLPSSPINSVLQSGFLSPPQRPFVRPAVPSPGGIGSPVQHVSLFNSSSLQNTRPLSPGRSQRPSGIPTPVQQPSSWQWSLRSSQRSGLGFTRSPVAAALDKNAATGGFQQRPSAMPGKGINVQPTTVHRQFISISQSTKWRSRSSFARGGLHKGGVGGREHDSRRTYSNSPRISRCFSPPPPDIKRVVRFGMSEDYYSKSQDHQGDNCHVQGTEKLMELHDRFEKEVLNMASLDQDDNDDESISNRRNHQKDEDNSDVESLSGSDGNDSPVKSRLRLFPSDDEDNSDEDDSEVGSHALSDSTSDSNNDDDDSHTGGGLSDDDDDDDDNDDAGYDHNHKGPSVAEIRKRKIEDPKRLHPELWFNEVGETNDGPVCRCSTADKQQGIRHSVYPGETAIKPCDPLTNNADKLHHYWVTVMPHTNFMTSNPTTIQAEGRDYTFEGFSMFCHYPLEQVPRCSVIRFNIEYTLHVISQPVPENFCVKDLDLFSEFLFYKVLELADWNFTGEIQDSCQQFHFMPRFVYRSSDKDDSKECHELLPMNQVLSHIANSAEPLIKLSHFDLGKEKWEEYNKSCRNAIVMNPAKKPVALRIDDLYFCKDSDGSCNSKVYPFIVHHSIRPVQMSFAGDPKYQRLLKTHNKLRNLIANTPVPTRKNQDKLVKLKIELEKMRLTSSMRRDVVVEVSSKGMIKTGLKSDVCQHALLLPVLVHHVRYHTCLHSLDSKLGYAFKDRALLQLALTHPSYHLNFGMNPDHARNSLSNCGVKQPRYGDRKVRHLHTRKKGITQLIRVMSNLGKMEEYQSIFADDYGTLANPTRKSTSRGRLIGGKTRNKLERIRHNERLEFLGDAVLELICSAHLYFMLPFKPEGGLAMYRSALVQNKHLAQLAKKLGLSDYMQYSHGPDLCLEEDLNHAMANCFEALLGALYLESGLKSATELFTKLAFDEEELRDVWTNLPKHPLQAQQPDGDRHLIASSELLQKLQEFEQASGIEFTHIRLLARAFTHAQVGFNNLTLGSNQRMEFLGDSVLQFVVSVYLFKHFPEHHEGHLTLLRSSLVNHRIQAKLARELGLDKLINFGGQAGLKAYREKLLADILEAFVAALYVDKGLRHVEVFCRVCLFPRLEEFIINQDWMDAKSQLQQCCLTSREQGKTPDLPQYKVLQNKGPAHHKHYTVAVYYKNKRLGSGEGKSIQQAEMAAAKDALSSHYFPELARQKRLLDRKHQGRRRNYWNKVPRREREKQEDQEEVVFEPQWKEMETFEVEWNRRSEENWEGDEPESQEKENWEMDDRSSETGENWDVESSDGRENWEEEINLTKDNWEEQRINARETWQGEKRNVEENWKGDRRDLRENSSEINGAKENWGEKRGENWEEENGELKENWEKEKSDARLDLERRNSDTKEHCEEQTSFFT